MASIRTIEISKDVKIEWHTGSIRGLYYDPKKVIDIHRNEIKPNLKLTDESDVRSEAHELFKKILSKPEYQTMFGFMNVVMAFRITDIDSTEKDEEGFYKVFWKSCRIESIEKMTWFNIAWHVNHHCRQLYKFCFVGYTYYGGTKQVSFTAGEGYDRKISSPFDSEDLFKKDKRERKNGRGW